MTFAPSYPHDPIETISDTIYMARGSIKMNPIIRITRNMAIIRHGAELTLVNPIRLNEHGLSQLDGLGQVKHVLRLGALHGIDDPFYMARYSPEFWCQQGGTTYTEPKVDHALSEGGELPFPNAVSFCFDGTNQPEGALLLSSGDGLLLTTDSIQNYGDYSNNNLPARLMLPFLGFPKTTLVGPIWLKLMTPEGGSLKSEFERLLSLKFDGLLSAHGTLLRTGAHQAVSAAVDKAFP
jgi:hypothetical protein